MEIVKRALSFPLRLCPSIRMQAMKLAKADGISLNHFISLAVAEKITRLEHNSWMEQQGKLPPTQQNHLVRTNAFNAHPLPIRRN